MACFTPKNNTYCSPNVNAFLDEGRSKFIMNEQIVIQSLSFQFLAMTSIGNCTLSSDAHKMLFSNYIFRL